MLVRQLDFVGLTVWWGTTVRSYSLLRDNCKILQFFQSTDSFFWQLSMAHWQLSHWQLSDLTVVRSDSCPIWQLSALTVVRSDSCPIWQLSDLTANVWQLSANQLSYICVWTLGLNSKFWLLTLLDLEVTLVLYSIPVGNHLSQVTLRYKRSLYFSSA